MKRAIPFRNDTHENNSNFISERIGSLDELCSRHLQSLEKYLESINFEASVTYLGIHGVMIPLPDLSKSKYFCFGTFAKPIKHAQKVLVRIISEHGLTCE